MHLITGQGISDGVIPDHLLILLWCDLLLKTIIQLGTGCRRKGIPHLRLSTALALTMSRLVIRMHLNRQVPTRIDEFYQ